MNEYKISRRQTLKQLIAAAAFGTVAALRPGASKALDKISAVYSTKIPGVSGKVISRSHSNYEMWRRALIWHHSKPKRFPELIVQAQSTDDVIAAVNYAAASNLKVSVRAGGHSSTGSSVRQGGIVIDVSALRDIQIDESTQVAAIQPGVRSIQLSLAAQFKGLSFPVAHCASVGLSGFTLGGGIGLNYPQNGGMATHSIVGAEVVTADGRILTVNAEENADLYWAVRGAGAGFFGVVTRLFLQLYPLPKAIMTSTYIFPLDQLDVVTTSLESIRSSHDVSRVEILAVLVQDPRAPAEATPEQSKICFFTAFAFEDSEAEAIAALSPFSNSDLAKKAAAKFENEPTTLFELHDKFFSLRDPAGRQGRYKVDNVLTNDGCGTLHALAEHFRQNAPAKDCHVLAGFNLNVKPKADSCFSWAADCYVGCYAIWDEEKDDEANYEWLRGTLPLMDPFAVGHYTNEIEPRHPDRYRKCFTDDNWMKLESLRKKYDPNAVFHHYLTQDDV